MKNSPSIPLSIESFAETDELTSLSVTRGFAIGIPVSDEYGSCFAESGEFKERFLARLSVSLGKYYHPMTISNDLQTADTVANLMHQLSDNRHCKIDSKYSLQQVYDAAMEFRDPVSIMIAVSGTTEALEDGSCIQELWTDIVLNGVGKVVEKMKAIGKKKKARNEFIQEWNSAVWFFRWQYDLGCLDRVIVLKWCLKTFQKCSTDQIYVLLMLLKGLICDFARSNEMSKLLVDSCIEKSNLLNSNMVVSGEDGVKFLQDLLCKVLEMVLKVNPDMLLLEKYQKLVGQGSFSFFQDFEISKEIEMRTIQLNFDKKVFQRINNSLFSKLQALDNNILYQFFLDSRKSFEKQIHNICSQAIGSILEDFYLTAVVAIQKAISFHKDGSSRIQEYLVSFLFLADWKNVEFDKLVKLYNELVRLDIFNYIKFLQWLISLGFLVSENPKRLFIMDLIKRLPFKVLSRPELIIKNMFLDDDSEVADIVNGFQVRILAAFPKVFLDINRVDVRREIPRNDQAADFEWNRIDAELLFSLAKIEIPRARVLLGSWIVESIYNFVAQKQQIGMDNWKNVVVAGTSLLNNRQFSSFMKILESLDAYGSIFKICMWMIERTNDHGILTSITNLIRQKPILYSSYADISSVFDILLKKYRDLKSKTTMVELCIGYYLLEIEGRIELGYTQEYKHELSQVYNHLMEAAPQIQMKGKFRELSGLIDGSTSVESSISSLLRKYRNHGHIIKHIFRNVFENLKDYSKKNQEFWNFRIIISRNVDVVRYLSLGSLSITEAFITLLKDQYQSLNQSTKHLFSEDWFISFSIQLIATRSVLLNKVLSTFAVPLLKKTLESKPTTNEASFIAHFLSFIRICLFNDLTEVISDNIFLTTSDLISLESIRSYDLEDEFSFFICYELFYQIYMLSKKAHEFAENLHIEIERLAGKIFSDQSWFCSVARRKCVSLYRSSKNASIHYTVSLLKLDSKINNVAYFSDWLKNPSELCHISVLLLLEFWNQNETLKFKDVAAQIMTQLFDSKSFNGVLTLLSSAHPEISLTLLEKLLSLYSVDSQDKQFKLKFLEVVETCCTHFTNGVKSESYFTAALSSIFNFSKIVFDQLNIAFEESHNVPKFIDILQHNIPFLCIFKSLSCFTVSEIFTIPRMKILLGVLISNSCIHGPSYIFNQLLDLIVVVLNELSPESIHQVFQQVNMTNINSKDCRLDVYKRLIRIFPFQNQYNDTSLKINESSIGSLKSKWDFSKISEWEQMCNIVSLPYGPENETSDSLGLSDLSQKIAMFERKRKRTTTDEFPNGKKIKQSE